MGQILNLLKSDEKKSEQKNHNTNSYPDRRHHYEYQHSNSTSYRSSLGQNSDWPRHNEFGGNFRNSTRSTNHSTFGENVSSEHRRSVRANTVTRPSSRLNTNHLQHPQYGHRSTGLIHSRRNKKTLYHYTTNENANTIVREKLVRSSTMSTPWKYRQHGCGE